MPNIKLKDESAGFNPLEKSIADLGALPYRLIVNQISNSIETYDHKTITDVADGFNKDEIIKYKKQQRYILILGAGASYSVSNKISLAKEAAAVIKNKLKINESSQLGKLIEDELNKLTSVYKLNREDFETQLFAFSKFFPDEVREELKQLFDRRYEVGKFYEIVGHLLKHRFIDVVINYNFDELLDNVLEEEIKGKDYTVIYSDGHCPKNYDKELLHEDNRGLKHPVYIKPHGTISHPSTMRFTRDDYYTISNEIDNLIRNLLIGEHHEEKYVYEINLIIVGFGMKSFELNQLIQETNKNRLINTYVFEYLDSEDYFRELHKEFDIDHSKVKNLDDQIKNKSFDLNKWNKPIFNHTYYPVKDVSIHEYFEKIWKKIYSCYKKPFKPKDIKRHQLLSLVFANENNLLNSYTSKVHYFKERVLFEIAVTYLKSDGIINFVIIENSRIHKYFKLYKQEGGKYNLSDLFKKMGFLPYRGYLTDTYKHRSFDKFNDPEKISISIFKFLKNNISNIITQDRLRENKEKIIQEYFIPLREKNRLTIHYSEDLKHRLKFTNLGNHSLIRTDLHWSYLYHEILEKKNDWDLVLAISEMGRFLMAKENLKFLKKKRVEIIVAEYNLENDFELFNSDNKIKLLSGEVLKLPWWLHNQHLAVFLKKRPIDSSTCLENNMEPVVGFYHTSRLLSRDISPIILKDFENLKTLVNIFTNYWYRARLIKENMAIDNISSYSELLEHRGKLLGMYKDDFNAK